MHVNQSAQYALRALMYMASVPRSTTVRSSELSKISGAPPAYLSKIMRRLVAGGLLEGTRGHGGGFVLARSPSRIRLRDILETAGGELERGTCIFGVGKCNSADPCPLHHSWNEMNEAFYSWSRRTTLADLKGRPVRRHSRRPRK